MNYLTVTNHLGDLPGLMAMWVAELKWAGRGWWAGGGCRQNGGMNAEGGATMGGDCCEELPMYAVNKTKIVMNFMVQCINLKLRKEFASKLKLNEWNNLHEIIVAYCWTWVFLLSSHLSTHCRGWGVGMLEIDKTIHNTLNHPDISAEGIWNITQNCSQKCEVTKIWQKYCIICV